MQVSYKVSLVCVGDIRLRCSLSCFCACPQPSRCTVGLNIFWVQGKVGIASTTGIVVATVVLSILRVLRVLRVLTLVLCVLLILLLVVLLLALLALTESAKASELSFSDTSYK